MEQGSTWEDVRRLRFELGRALARSDEDREEAVILLRQALEEHGDTPSATEVLNELGAALVALERPKDALDALCRARPGEPGFAEVVSQLAALVEGGLVLSARRAERLQRDWTDPESLDPEQRAWVADLLARVHRSLGNYAEARRWIARAPGGEDEHHDELDALDLLIAVSESRYADAVTLLDRVPIAFSGADALAVAEACLATGDASRAEASLEDRTDVAALQLRALAEALADDGDDHIARAIEHVERLGRLDPGGPESLRVALVVRIRTGDWRRARELAELLVSSRASESSMTHRVLRALRTHLDQIVTAHYSAVPILSNTAADPGPLAEVQTRLAEVTDASTSGPERAVALRLAVDVAERLGEPEDIVRARLDDAIEEARFVGRWEDAFTLGGRSWDRSDRQDRSIAWKLAEAGLMWSFDLPMPSADGARTQATEIVERSIEVWQEGATLGSPAVEEQWTFASRGRLALRAVRVCPAAHGRARAWQALAYLTAGAMLDSDVLYDTLLWDALNDLDLFWWSRAAAAVAIGHDDESSAAWWVSAASASHLGLADEAATAAAAFDKLGSAAELDDVRALLLLQAGDLDQLRHLATIDGAGSWIRRLHAEALLRNGDAESASRIHEQLIRERDGAEVDRLFAAYELGDYGDVRTFAREQLARGSVDLLDLHQLSGLAALAEDDAVDGLEHLRAYLRLNCSPLFLRELRDIDFPRLATRAALSPACQAAVETLTGDIDARLALLDPSDPPLAEELAGHLSADELPPDPQRWPDDGESPSWRAAAVALLHMWRAVDTDAEWPLLATIVNDDDWPREPGARILRSTFVDARLNARIEGWSGDNAELVERLAPFAGCPAGGRYLAHAHVREAVDAVRAGDPERARAEGRAALELDPDGHEMVGALENALLGAWDHLRLDEWLVSLDAPTRPDVLAFARARVGAGLAAALSLRDTVVPAVPPIIRLLIAHQLVPDDTSTEGWSLFSELIPRMRLDLEASTGVRLPGVRVTTHDRPSGWEIQIDGVAVLRSSVDPAGPGDPMAPIVDALAAVLRDRIDRFAGPEEVVRWLDEASKPGDPSVVAKVLHAACQELRDGRMPIDVTTLARSGAISEDASVSGVAR